MAKHIEYKLGDRQMALMMGSYQRSKILTNKCELVVESWKEVAENTGMELLCWVVLTDHFHVVIDKNFNSLNTLTHAFKLASAKRFHLEPVAGRTQLWEAASWSQKINNQSELEQHIDFVHYNPVKHGLVGKPWDFQQSSFREFVKHGYYFKDWTLDADQRQIMKPLDESDAS